MATTEVIWLENLGVIFYSFSFINSFSRIWELLAVGGNILLLTNIGQKDTIAFLTLLFKPSIRVSIVYDGIPRVRKVKIFTL